MRGKLKKLEFPIRDLRSRERRSLVRGLPLRWFIDPVEELGVRPTCDAWGRVVDTSVLTNEFGSCRIAAVREQVEAWDRGLPDAIAGSMSPWRLGGANERSAWLRTSNIEAENVIEEVALKFARLVANDTGQGNRLRAQSGLVAALALSDQRCQRMDRWPGGHEGPKAGDAEDVLAYLEVFGPTELSSHMVDVLFRHEPVIWSAAVTSPVFRGWQQLEATGAYGFAFFAECIGGVTYGKRLGDGTMEVSKRLEPLGMTAVRWPGTSRRERFERFVEQTDFALFVPENAFGDPDVFLSPVLMAEHVDVAMPCETSAPSARERLAESGLLVGDTDPVISRPARHRRELRQMRRELFELCAANGANVKPDFDLHPGWLESP